MSVGEPLGIGFLGLGFSPKWTLAETPHMPKERYSIMTRYMPTVGARGLDMMYRTATIQVNLDFADEADMVKKLRVSLALQPIATALFASSPFTEGRLNGFKSMRSEVWRDTDRRRTGMLPFAFENGMGYERYVDYALAVPMYFVYRHGRYIDASGASFQDFLDGKLPQLPGERPTLDDWSDHLTTLFPEVRLKRFLETRGADSGPWQRICALPAFWVGLLYDAQALDAAWQLVKDWTAEERDALRNAVPKSALATPFRNTTVQHIAREALRISRRGLRARRRINAASQDEAVYLDILDEVAISGCTLADRLIERYEGPGRATSTMSLKNMPFKGLARRFSLCSSYVRLSGTQGARDIHLDIPFRRSASAAASRRENELVVRANFLALAAGAVAAAFLAAVTYFGPAEAEGGCGGSCAHAYNQCRIQTKGSASCEKQYSSCLQSCRKR